MGICNLYVLTQRQSCEPGVVEPHRVAVVTAVITLDRRAEYQLAAGVYLHLLGRPMGDAIHTLAGA